MEFRRDNACMASEELKGSDLLTFGEAAEYAGVSLLDLRERLREAGVSAVWGWRAGSAIHLVTLESLQSTFPGLGDRRRLPNRSLKERGIEILPESPRAAAPNEPSKVKSEGGAAERQLIELHGEIEAAVNQNAKLIAELSDAGSGIDKVLGDAKGKSLQSPHASWVDSLRPSKPSSRDRVQQWNELEAQQRELDEERKRKQLRSWLITTLAAVCFIAVVSIKSKQLLLASSGPDAAPSMAGVDSERRPENINGQPSTELASPTTSSPMGLTPPGHESELLSSASNLVSFETASGTAPPTASEGEFAELSNSQPAPTEADAPVQLVPLAGEEVQDDSEEVQVDGEETVTTQPAVEVSPGASLAPLVLSKGPACLYAKLTAPGQELRAVLGPCIGPWNEKTHTVTGGFRHSGERYCRHHLIVAKDLGGSVDRARNVASYARKEGLLPPLVRLRVEHGAADLLQMRVGKWVESGFEAGLSGQHEVRQGDTEDHWSVRSWVRLQAKPGGKAELKRFQMELELGADKGRDRWVSFDWLPEEPSSK